MGLFGGPLLIGEGVLWLLGFFGSARGARRLLKPLDRMAETAQRLTDENNLRRAAEREQARRGLDEEKFHSLEHAIEQIDIGDRLSTGDKDLQGLEDAINDLLGRMHAAYRQQAQFVSDASHELRTPIAVIQGYVKMLDRWGKDDEKVLEESIAAIKTETGAHEDPGGAAAVPGPRRQRPPADEPRADGPGRAGPGCWRNTA